MPPIDFGVRGSRMVVAPRPLPEDGAPEDDMIGRCEGHNDRLIVPVRLRTSRRQQPARRELSWRR